MENILLVLAILGGIGGFVYLCTLVYGLIFKTKQDIILERSKLICSTVIEVFEYVNGLPQTKNVKLRKLFEKGMQYHKERRFKDALAAFKGCLHLQPKLGEIAALQIIIGNLLYRIFKLDEALQYHDRAFELANEVNDVEAKFAILACRACVYFRKGKLDASYADLQQALSYCEKKGEKDENSILEKAAVLSEIGQIFRTKHDFEQALSYFKNSKSLYKRVDSKKGIADESTNLAAVYLKMNDLESAEDCLVEALNIHKLIQDELRVGLDKMGLGAIYNKRQKLTKALKYHKQALKVFERYGDLWNKADCLNNMGIIYAKKGRFKKATPFCEDALGLHRRLGNPVEIANAELSLGLVYFVQSEIVKAETLLNQSLEKYRSVDLPHEIQRAQRIIQLIEEYKMKLRKK